MPIALISIGILFIVAGYNGTQQKLFGMVTKTYAEAKGLGAWVLVALILGVLASVTEIKEPVNALMILICLGLALTLHKGK